MSMELGLVSDATDTMSTVICELLGTDNNNNMFQHNKPVLLTLLGIDQNGSLIVYGVPGTALPWYVCTSLT